MIEMKTLTIKDNTYEIVDDAARKQIDTLQETVDGIIESGSGTSSSCVTVDMTDAIDEQDAPSKPVEPLTINGEDFYPITSADQIILSDGTKLETDGKLNIKTTTTVNSIPADENGNIALTAQNVGALSIDKEGAVSGTSVPVNADTLGGIAAENYALKSNVSEFALPSGGASGQVLSVWFNVDSSLSDATFNALEKDAIQINPIKASVYENGQWWIKGAKIYVDGAWVVFSTKTLFFLSSAGFENTTIHGGFELVYTHADSGGEESVVINDNSIVLTAKHLSGLGCATCVNKESIDFSGFDTLAVRVASTLGISNTWSARVAIANDRTLGYGASGSYSAYANIETSGEVLLPLSGISSGYIILYVACTDSGGTVTYTVDEIKLLRREA